jgi:hypothetical protein
VSDAPHLVCCSENDVTPEQARDARARALSYAIRTYLAKQQAADTSGGQDDPKETNSEKNQPRETYHAEPSPRGAGPTPAYGYP